MDDSKWLEGYFAFEDWRQNVFGYEGFLKEDFGLEDKTRSDSRLAQGETSVSDKKFIETLIDQGSKSNIRNNDSTNSDQEPIGVSDIRQYLSNRHLKPTVKSDPLALTQESKGRANVTITVEYNLTQKITALTAVREINAQALSAKGTEMSLSDAGINKVYFVPTGNSFLDSFLRYVSLESSNMAFKRDGFHATLKFAQNATDLDKMVYGSRLANYEIIFKPVGVHLKRLSDL
ncbi:MAG: hypothetical protein ACP5N2_06630 [Candidatus Nanoarchaeia archaeon]